MNYVYICIILCYTIEFCEILKKSRKLCKVLQKCVTQRGSTNSRWGRPARHSEGTSDGGEGGSGSARPMGAKRVESNRTEWKGAEMEQERIGGERERADERRVSERAEVTARCIPPSQVQG